MAEQKIQQLLVLAVQSVKAGDKDKGRQAFLAALKLDPNNETAWMGLVSVAKDNRERLTALKKVLTLNPDNAKAQAVLDKLGVPRERLMGDAPPPEPEPPVSSSPFDDSLPQSTAGDFSEFDSPYAYEEPDEDFGSPYDEPDDEFGSATTDETFDDFRSSFDEPTDDFGYAYDEPDDEFGSATDDESFDEFESAEYEDEPTAFVDPSDMASGQQAFVPDAFNAPVEPEPEPAPSVPQQSVFELPPPMLGTEVGVPVANPQALGRVTQDVENLVSAYLEDEYVFDNIKWVHKTKRRAGEADIWKWRAQVFSVVTLVLLVFVGLPATLFLTSPEGQKVVFAPTSTQTPTFTFTPSHTPGITPTPSSIPQETFTPTPTFFLQGVEGRLDLNASPTATTVYSPAGLLVGPNILEAWELIRNEAYQDAFDILEDEKLAYEAGYPYPYYLQSQIDLANDDPEKALEKLEAGEAQLANINTEDAESYMPMYHLGYGELRFYEALQAQAEGRTNDANQRFGEAEDRFRTAIDIEGRIIPAYIQLARVLVAQEEYQEAINVLNIPIEGDLSNEYFTDIALRVERGRVYFAQGDYPRALQEANEALFFEPWSEAAYILQAEAALAMDRPGEANDFLDGYQLVYPNSLLAFKLEGDAYRLEGKADQALLAYNIALQDNEDRPDYLTVLEARADLYFEQRRYDLAQESYTRYLDDRSSEEVRAKRMLSAYNARDYDVALRDARQLEDSRVISNGELALIEGQILTDTAVTLADYDDAFAKLSEALLTLGIPEDQRPIADEYLARVNFELGNLEQALVNIDRALLANETGSRRYLKGLILQEQEAYEAARFEYEYVLAWSEIFPYPFLDDVRERYDEVVDLIENPPEEDGA